MLKRTCAFVVASLLGIAALGVAPASAKTPIDPAGTYHDHSNALGETCTVTLTDTSGITGGTYTDTCMGSGFWSVTGSTIVLASDTSAHPDICPIIVTGKLTKKSISNAKKPGTLFAAVPCNASYTYWASR
jgi:hypothetical protein